MEALLKTILMGIVEGITEFLPVSSTGHLLLTNALIDFDKVMGGEKAAKAFEIIIQFGAILAILFVFPKRFARLAQFKDNQGLAGIRGLWLLLLTCIPAGILGFLLNRKIEDKLMDPSLAPITVAAAFAVGAFWMLAVEWYRPKTKIVGLDSMTWREALLMGVYQCFGLWPGMSRSGSTILGGMMSNIDRKTAAEYSFLAGVPLMFAATVFSLHKHYHDLDLSQWNLLAVGFVVSFFTAWIAVKLFIHFLSRHTLVSFAIYRLLAAAAVAWWMIDWAIVRHGLG
ncbi:MAG: undecaprenyl-diphosphate phosphatase [Planctomycetota bacterium]